MKLIATLGFVLTFEPTALAQFDARIASLELAFREAVEAFDISKESEATQEQYGTDKPELSIKGSFLRSPKKGVSLCL